MCSSECTFCIGFISIVTPMFFLLIIFLITNPQNIKFHVTDASLTQFNLTSNNTLYYNFKVNITANPGNVKVNYTRIAAMASYKDNDFGWVSLAPFDHKNTSFPQAVFQGHSVIRLQQKQLGEYKKETSVGIYTDLAVEFDLTTKAKFHRFHNPNWDSIYVLCRHPRVPLISNGKTTPPFSVTKCEVVF